MCSLRRDSAPQLLPCGHPRFAGLVSCVDKMRLWVLSRTGSGLGSDSRSKDGERVPHRGWRCACAITLGWSWALTPDLADIRVGPPDIGSVFGSEERLDLWVVSYDHLLKSTKATSSRRRYLANYPGVRATEHCEKIYNEVQNGTMTPLITPMPTSAVLEELKMMYVGLTVGVC